VKPTAILLHGPPGSGKGTQGRLLAGRSGCPHVVSGDLIRDRLAGGFPVGGYDFGLLGDGRFAPDEAVFELVRWRVALPDCAKGFILDGFPRTLWQAEALEGLLAALGFGQLVIHLKVDYNRVGLRLQERWFCPVCGAAGRRSQEAGLPLPVCLADGSVLVRRADDRREIIERRWLEYESRTLPLLSYWQGRRIDVRSICGEPDAQAVHDEVWAAIGGSVVG
jgi:adenylate kinase